MRKRQVSLLVLAVSPLMFGMGGECPANPGTTTPMGNPGATTIRLEMENQTGEQLEPGLRANDGPPLSNVIQPGQTLVFSASPCGPGRRLHFAGRGLESPKYLTDAAAVTITEGADYSCRNTVHVTYTVSGSQIVNTVTAN